MAFGGGGSASSELTAHTHNQALTGDGGQLSETLTDMNGVTLFSLIEGIAGVPTGAILMWSGLLSAIPSGWVLCDGTGGTPNLLAKFIRGIATDATNPQHGKKFESTTAHARTIGSESGCGADRHRWRAPLTQGSEGAAHAQ